MGLMLTMAARVWRTVEQREKETQLLWVGHAYRLAISSYYAFGHRYPATLDVLLTDDRFPVPKHHLRQLYFDPMTGKNDWTLILTPDQNAIQGVASSSQETPIKRDAFDMLDVGFKDSDCYCQWKFVFTPRWGGTGSGGWITSPPVLDQPPPAPGSPTTAPGVPLPLNGSPPPVTPNPTPNKSQP